MNAHAIAGFVKRCSDNGLGANETEHLFLHYAANNLLSDPFIRSGLQEGLDSYRGPLLKSAFARVMQPAQITEIVENFIDEGKSAGAIALRKVHPKHQALTEEFKQASWLRPLESTDAQRSLSRFESMPLSDKLTLMTAAGAGIGGLENAANPHPDDVLAGRKSKTHRGLRGAVRGGMIGGGGLLGATMAGDLASRFDNENGGAGQKSHNLAKVMGALIGGVSGKTLANGLLS